MMKHGIIDVIPNIPSNNEVEVELEDGVSQGDGLEVRNKFATTAVKIKIQPEATAFIFHFFWSFRPFDCIDAFWPFFGCYK